MVAHRLMCAAGAVVGAASVVSGQFNPAELRVASIGVRVEPERIAPAVLRDGRLLLLGEWGPYSPSGRAGSPELDVPIFDCFGDADADGVPDGGLACGLFSETSRWWFGSEYCNLFWTNDMTVASDTVIRSGAYRADLAWWWTVRGSFTSERCIIAIFTQESEPCEPDSFDYEGWLFDFGTLPSTNGGGYYYNNITLSDGVWRLPSGGSGSYAVMYLREVTTSGAWTLATCAQPMLWGTGDARDNPGAPGTQGPYQFDDDVGMDGSHTSSECNSYSYSSLCPTVLGGMIQFWGDRYGDCLQQFPNCDGNNTVDTRDFLCYLSKWAGSFNGQYDPEADCDGNGAVDTNDVNCFLTQLATCRW